MFHSFNNLLKIFSNYLLMVSKDKSQFSSSGKKKLKYKKNALEYVDKELEFQKDNRYKTELCASFSENNFCVYGNKCRFAHGRDELFDKNSSHPNFRQKDCLSFHNAGYCNYGKRCHFRHNDHIKIQNLNRSYYAYLLNLYQFPKILQVSRLPVFRKTCSINSSLNQSLDLSQNYLKQLYVINTPITPLAYVRKWSDTSSSSPEILRSPIMVQSARKNQNKHNLTSFMQ